MVNVQQMIDTLRDIFHGYSTEDLTTNISDSDFIAKLKEFALTANKQRMAMFAKGKPGDAATEASGANSGEPSANSNSVDSGEPPANSNNANSGKPPANGGAANEPAGTSSFESADVTLVTQLASIVADVFGYTMAS